MNPDEAWLRQLTDDVAAARLWAADMRDHLTLTVECSWRECPTGADRYVRLGCGCLHVVCGPHHGIHVLGVNVARQRRRPVRCDTCGSATSARLMRGGLL